MVVPSSRRIVIRLRPPIATSNCWLCSGWCRRVIVIRSGVFRRMYLVYASLPKLQASARQETLELASHEHRQWAVGGLDLVDEAAEVLVEHTVENRLGRPTSAIGG